MTDHKAVRFLKTNTRLLAIIASLLLAPLAHADGSISFSNHIVQLLTSRPLFAQFIEQTFSITDAGWGTRIDSPTMPEMSGARMGPYSFRAIWHGPKGDIPVTLVIVTRTRFFDKHHREILGDDLRKAVSITETLDSIEVEPPKRD